MTRRMCFNYQMFVSLKDQWVLDSLAVDDSYCYNSVCALPPDVIAKRIDYPMHMQWDSSCSISVRFVKGAQFNVQTLLQFSSRKHLLANFIKQHFFFGCFQEARSPSGRSRCIDNVVMLASASDKGNYGCEVWVNLSSHVCVYDGKKIYLTRDGVTAVFRSPRVLIVRCKALKFDVYIISAHAPYCKSPTDCSSAREWWVNFSKIILSTCCGGIPVIIGTDANYVVHDGASVGIGDVHCSSEPPPQHASVCDFLNDVNFTVFDSFKNLLGHTVARGVPSYVPKKSNVCDAVCIDHFVGSSDVICKPHSIVQCSELAHIQAADDHIPIAGFFQFPTVRSVAPIPRKKVRYDKASLGDPVKSLNFINLLNNLPVVKCNVDNTSHCHILQHNVHDALCEAFPSNKIKRKSFISADTFKYICEAADMKRKKCRFFERFQRASLWAMFGVWAHMPWRCQWSCVWGFSKYSNLHTWVKTGFAIQYLNTHITGMLKLEALAFFNESADNVVSSFNSGDAKMLFSSINNVLKVANNKAATPKCLRVVDSQTGLPSQGIVQEKKAFRQHFSNLMGGEVGTFSSLVQKDRHPSASRYNNVTEDEIQAVPTLIDLFKCFSNFKKGKACGEGLLVSDIFKLFPFHLSRVFFPLVVKTFVRIQPPLQWKGGMICDLFKNKGSPALISSYRDVLLMDDDGKGVQRLLRKKLFPLANLLCVDSQFGGGLNGGETAIAHLYLRLFVDSIIFFAQVWRHCFL